MIALTGPDSGMVILGLSWLVFSSFDDDTEPIDEAFDEELFDEELFDEELFDEELFDEEPSDEEPFDEELFDEEPFDEEPFDDKVFLGTLTDDAGIDGGARGFVVCLRAGFNET